MISAFYAIAHKVVKLQPKKTAKITGSVSKVCVISCFDMAINV